MFFKYICAFLLICEINYINYDNDLMLDGNFMYPIIHKQTAYKYEDEVRLIHQSEPIGLQHDWTKEEIQEGLYIKTDLNELIDEIIIGPYSPKWFLILVRDISNKYALDKAIKNSNLSMTE